MATPKKKATAKTAPKKKVTAKKKVATKAPAKKKVLAKEKPVKKAPETVKKTTKKVIATKAPVKKVTKKAAVKAPVKKAPARKRAVTPTKSFVEETVVTETLPVEVPVVFLMEDWTKPVEDEKIEPKKDLEERYAHLLSDTTQEPVDEEEGECEPIDENPSIDVLPQLHQESEVTNTTTSYNSLTISEDEIPWDVEDDSIHYEEGGDVHIETIYDVENVKKDKSVYIVIAILLLIFGVVFFGSDAFNSNKTENIKSTVDSTTAVIDTILPLSIDSLKTDTNTTNNNNTPSVTDSTTNQVSQSVTPAFAIKKEPVLRAKKTSRDSLGKSLTQRERDSISIESNKSAPPIITRYN